MPQATDAKDSNQVRGAGTAHLYRLVGRDARAGQRSSLQRLHVCGHLPDIPGKRLGVFSVGPIEEVAGVELFLTQRLPS